jgi:hypothetical protein
MIEYSKQTLANRLQNAYFHANEAHLRAGHGRLTKGKFMQQAYPGQNYKNEASARRQFNKVTSLRGGKGIESSGVRIEKRGRVLGPGMRQAGLWKVDVEYDYEDNDGTEQHAARSFLLESGQYTRMEDAPYIYAILPPLIEMKIAQWQETGSAPQNAYNVTVWLMPIARTNLTQDRIVQIDDVEVA